MLIDPTPMSRKAPLPHNWKPRQSMSRYPFYLSIFYSDRRIYNPHSDIIKLNWNKEEDFMGRKERKE
ncbi:hypothetical protein [Thermoanaerobacterium sp. DL9XJH110]|uniref:hypothetical protein n=1 Tax=Thermoanaerobacterium sp. DL9XJH110 TaxID=3386643 RepID=UPI003BB6B373